MINIYAAELENIIAKSPVVISHRFQLSITGPATEYIEALALFENGSKLSVFEFLRFDHTQVNRDKYRYQYMEKDGREIFRYDNAPHHKSVDSFPHHKHMDNMVSRSTSPPLSIVLREVEQKILKIF